MASKKVVEVFSKGDRVQHRTTKKMGTVAREVNHPGTMYGVVSVQWDGQEGTMACLPGGLKKIAENA